MLVAPVVTRQLCGALESPITDEDRARDFHASTLFALYGAVANDESVSIVDKHEFYVQGSEDCVLVSHVSSVNTLARIRGVPFARKPGACRPFCTTQIRQGMLVAGKGLPNTGSACSFGLAELRDTGTCADADYPDTNENASRVPPEEAFAAPVIFRIKGEHRILFEGSPDAETILRTGIIAALQSAKAGRSAPPTACMTVDDAYGNLPVDVVYSATGGAVWGGHCQVIVAYDAERDAIGFASSWGGERVFWVSLPWFAKNGAAAFVIEDYVV